MVQKLVFLTALLCVNPVSAAEPFVILQGTSQTAPKQPQACVDADGIVHLAFGVGEQIYYGKVEGNQASEPQAVVAVPNMSLGMRRGPRIAKSGNAIVITAIGGKQGKGRDGDVLAYSSFDSGMTWTGPVRVNDVESSGREGLHAMASTPGGELWCVWLDLRTKKTQLFAAKSTDQGKSWSKNIHVYSSPDGSVCECCHPSIIADGRTIDVLFRNSLAGNRDMYLVSSSDQGVTFRTAQRLGAHHWSLNACPMDGGMLAKLSSGEVLSVWRRGQTIHTTGGKTSTESNFGTGEQPWIAANNTGAYLAWVTKRDGDLMLEQHGSESSETIALNARDPVVVAGNGSHSTVHLFWEQRTGDQTAIMGLQVK